MGETSAGLEASELRAEQKQPQDFVSISQPEPEGDAYGSVVDAMLALLKESRAEDWFAGRCASVQCRCGTGWTEASGKAGSV